MTRWCCRNLRTKYLEILKHDGIFDTRKVISKVYTNNRKVRQLLLSDFSDMRAERIRYGCGLWVTLVAVVSVGVISEGGTNKKTTHYLKVYDKGRQHGVFPCVCLYLTPSLRAGGCVFIRIFGLRSDFMAVPGIRSISKPVWRTSACFGRTIHAFG